MPDKFISKAKEIILKNDIGIGLKAGNYYPDIWTRDALISSLGLSMSEDEKLIKIAKTSINLIAKYQKFTGQIPDKISPDETKVSFGEGGCVDSSLWYPISVLEYFKKTKDRAFLKSHHNRIENAVSWAVGLDQNNDWMIETNSGSGWTDTLLRSGRVLYNNVLLYKALNDADEINHFLEKDKRWGWIAENLKEHINMFLWPDRESLDHIKSMYGHTGLDKDIETVLFYEKGERNFYLAELGFRTHDPRFDSFANILAVLFDVAPPDRKEKILREIEARNLCNPYPIKVLDPPIYRNDPFWNLYFRWTDLPVLQDPGSCQNGGVWPFAGGFYIAALKKEKKPIGPNFDNLVKSCEQGDWRFSHWLTSDGTPGGSSEQTLSAAMLLYAHYC